MSEPLTMVESSCSVCGLRDRAVLVATGEDFEYRSSDDSFTMYRCDRCHVLFLDPRPDRTELGRIYPDDYHAFEFTSEQFGLSYKVRRSLERRRLLDWCGSVPPGGAIVDVGAGDGFHLGILRDFGRPDWHLTAVEPDQKAADAIAQRGLTAHSGFLEDLNLESDQFDFAIMIMVIEHADDPQALLAEVHRVLKPGGRLGIVTDNIESLDSRFGKSRHWGGYHFPRHFNLYSKRSLQLVAASAGFEIERLTTMVSPVNWTYTVHNRLADRGSSARLTDLFSLKSAIPLAGFTIADTVARAFGRGALLRATLRKPVGPPRVWP